MEHCVAGKVAVTAVEKCSYSFDSRFSYLIPKELQPELKEGMRVLVPFGRANTARLAIVLSVEKIPDGTDVSALKTVISVLDAEPLLGHEQLLMIPWLAEQTFSTLFSCARVMLPAGACAVVERLWSLSCVSADECENENEQRVAALLSTAKKPVKESVLLQRLGISNGSAVLRKMAKKGLVSSESGTFERVRELSQRMFALSEKADTEKLTEKQSAVAAFLRDAESATVKDICYFTGVGESVVGTLLKKGILTAFDVEKRRTPATYFPDKKGRYLLSDEQKKAYEKLLEVYNSEESGAALLYGVTGSGKTGVYSELIEKAVADGRGVIVLVPEISLTPQCASIFMNRFGDRVAVLHSGMSAGERFDEWHRIKRGEATVVIGTRSAVFAPVKNLGLIVIDEEQEHTYKSETSPRYNAKDAARFRCAYNKAALVLASATPSVETFAKARAGKYTLCELTKRFGKAELPEVRTVDMTDKTLLHRFMSLSRPLVEEIEQNCKNGQQSIILVNRRGYNTFVVCRECKHVVTCPNCSISMTYHSVNNRLMCHYCGYSTPFGTVCPECGAQNIRYSGFGTQKVQQELQSLLPDKKILRMDADTTTAKNAHDIALGAFANGEYDILIGTQMVAKGLDFPNVTLVGIASADGELYDDDFRSSERVFDLITQVVGRAGRGNIKGRAVIQTVSPGNDIISLAAKQDYVSFYEREIILRKAMIYPPFCDICVVGFSGESEEKCVRCADDFLRKLVCENNGENGIKMVVLGPIAPKAERLGGRYRRRIIIKTKNTSKFRAVLSALLKEVSSDKNNRAVNVYADINPENTD